MLRQHALTSRSLALLRRLQHSFQTQRWQWLLGILAFTIVNGYIVYRLYREWDQITAFEWQRVQPQYLIFAAIIQFIGLLLVVGVWGYILRQYGYEIPYRRHFKVYTLSNLARKLPGGLGVDLLSRVYLYGKDGGDRVQVSFATLLEPIILGIAATIVLLLTLLISGISQTYINPLILVGVLAGFLIIIPSPLFRLLLKRISRGTAEHSQLRWHHLYRWVAFNTLTIALGGVTLFLFCRSFGVVEDSSLPMLIQYWALVVVSSVLLIWLPVDLGVANGITVLALATLMPMPQAIVLLVAWRVWTTVTEMVWGALGFIL